MLIPNNGEFENPYDHWMGLGLPEGWATILVPDDVELDCWIVCDGYFRPSQKELSDYHFLTGNHVGVWPKEFTQWYLVLPPSLLSLSTTGI